MKTWILAGLAATSVGGAAYYVLDPGPEAVEGAVQTSDGNRRAKAKGKTKLPPRAERGNEPLEERVAALEEEVHALRLQLGRERAGVLGGLRERGHDADLDPEPDGPLADQVRSIVEEERERERERRDDQRRERWTQRSEERLDELAQRANLSTEHREAISSLWTSERERMMAMFEEARGGDRDFREVRDSIGKLREETDREAQALLSPEQYEAYAELRPRGPGGRGGRGGGEGRPTG